MVTAFIPIGLASCSNLMMQELEKIDGGNDQKQEVSCEVLVFSEDEDGDYSLIPPPPGSNLLQTRKRGNTLYRSASDMKNLNAKDVFCNPEAYEYNRSDSDETQVENWDGFILDIDTMYSRSSSSSSYDSSPDGNTQIDPASQLKHYFATISKTRSWSFPKRSRRKLGLLSSHSENETDLDDLSS